MYHLIPVTVPINKCMMKTQNVISISRMSFTLPLNAWQISVCGHLMTTHEIIQVCTVCPVTSWSLSHLMVPTEDAKMVHKYILIKEKRLSHFLKQLVTVVFSKTLLIQEGTFVRDYLQQWINTHLVLQ